mmetsp:Transcript_29025/g.60389  ORF Transcript_29025/g.60389 Transcript_29025/m.60389 type:complete len:817 (+) Transcript_29025:266-2716(+)
MLPALRTAARRASQRGFALNASSNISKSSVAAAAIFVSALVIQKSREEKKEKIPNEIKYNSSNEASVNPLPKESPRMPTEPATCHCEHSSSTNFHSRVMPDHDLRLQRAVTSRRMAAEAVQKTFFSLYEVDFDHPLGSGAYGDVYLCREISTGEECALKKISKEFTEDVELQREMNALLHIRAHGGHPNVCMLRENFDEEDDYLLVLDLVMGKELFDHLIEHGAYSEADASRLLRQVASALDFIHGIGVVHADLKPENIMLRSTRGDSVIKLIDFGCSEVLSHPEEHDGERLPVRHLTHRDGATTAYCPPEAFDDGTVAIDPSADMWALGIILYMMLVGRHPFDLDCDATDEQIAQRIREQRQPPLKGCNLTKHISPSALDLLHRLLEPDPKNRMTAHNMLHHPWVTGETASEDVMKDSVKRLKALQRYKSGIEKTVIESLISFSDDDDNGEVKTKFNLSERRTSLLERAFDHIDKDKKGFLSKDDLKSLRPATLKRRNTSKEDINVSFNHFSDFVGQNMRSLHFPRGHVIYNEGDEGDYMYFINSGTIEVSTKDGFRTKKGQGDHFGKGGVLGRKRRTTITCTTPVSVLRIDKDLFKKYIIEGSPLALKLREKINMERFDRAVSIIKRNGNLSETTFKKGDLVFKEGDVPKEAFILKEGLVDTIVGDHHIYTVKTGHLFGTQSYILKRNRKTTCVCKSDKCVIQSISLEDLDELTKKYPELRNTIYELSLRQEFRRAVVLRRMKSFPKKSQLREVFDELDKDRSGKLDADELKLIMHDLGRGFSDEEILLLVKTLDLNESGFINFDEFQSVYGNA